MQKKCKFCTGFSVYYFFLFDSFEKNPVFFWSRTEFFLNTSVFFKTLASRTESVLKNSEKPSVLVESNSIFLKHQCFFLNTSESNRTLAPVATSANSVAKSASSRIGHYIVFILSKTRIILIFRTKSKI